MDQQCAESLIRFTTFRDNAVGLFYTENISISGPQIEAGNEWIGSFTNIAARHLGALEDIQESRYFVPLPVGSVLWPSPIDPPINWFDIGTNPSNCEVDDTCGDALNIPPNPDNSINSFDITTAQDGQAVGAYATVRDWEAKYRLYQKLYHQPNLLGLNLDIDQFYQQEQANVLSQQTELDFELGRLAETPQELSNNLVATESVVQELNLLDSLYFVAANLDSNSYLQQRNPWLDSLQSLVLEYGQTIDEITVLRNQELGQLIINNQNISPNNTPSANQKLVNDIYLHTLAQGISSLNTSQANDLLAIAGQCPNTGGQAVIRARALYNIFIPQHFDNSACSNQGLQLATPDLNASIEAGLAFIKPNPSGGIIELIIPSTTIEQGYDGWLLRDLTGRTLLSSQRYLPVANQTKIDASHLPKGVYFLTLMGENPITLKLVFQP